MKFTLSWLKDYLETDATVEQLVTALNDIGLEVEGLENPGEALSGFSVGKIIEARQHPDADRLKVCDVETANGMVQVVCGAPNAKTGLTGIFAGAGTYIPGTGVDLQKGIIRGVESAGMMCSQRELMISDEHDGIIELEGDHAVGTSAAEALGIDDPVFDIAITPNRPDALGIYGVARDLAAKGIGTLKPLIINKVSGEFSSDISVSIDLDDDNKACPLFIGRYFRNIKNGPSPEWLQRRLRAIGLRPISALVDITNYVSFAHARPLHVFDADKLDGNITIRMARNGEKINALDEKTYELDDSMTVIADAAGPQALGGIMGGMDSGCSDETINVFLEVALFDPIRTATTGRKLNIISDARYRFERGVDPGFTFDGAELATEMILQLCGGEASDLVIAGKMPDYSRSFFLRSSRVKTLGGLDIKLSQQARILTDLGFAVTEKSDGLECSVPGWRPDVNGEADLVEEVCRIAGLDTIEPVAMPRSDAVAKPVLNLQQRRMLKTRRCLAGRGLHEAVTYSFLPEKLAVMFGGGDECLKLANPISVELSDMRPSLLPNLIAAAGRNHARGYPDVRLFELGQTYKGLEPDEEELRAAAIRTGFDSPRHWAGPNRAVDSFDAKTDIMQALAAAGAPVNSVQIIQGGPEWYHPGRCGTVQLGPKNQLGWFGELHPGVLAKMGIKGPVCGFEMVINNIPAPKRKTSARGALNISDLMAVKRDFAFIVNEDIAAGKLVQAVRGADKKLISDVSVFDLFVGKSVGEGKKSLAVEVTLQPDSQTLTDEDIETVSKKIIDKVGKATGGVLRG